MSESRTVIVAISKCDSADYDQKPVKKDFNAWAIPIPVGFDDMVQGVIGSLDPKVKQHINSVIVSSAHGDAHAKNRILDTEKALKKPRGRPSDALSTTESTLMSLISRALPGADDIFKVDAACASGMRALQVAAMMAANTDRVILCLGIETTATAYYTYCFASLRATTEHPDRYFGPFDRNRNGFALGEGAACVAVCSESTARNLGLPVVAVLDKVSNFTLCPDSPTQPSDTNRIFNWLDQVIGSSLRNPGLAYWDAHATATPLGDAAEYEIFSRFNVDVPISSYKGLVGHCVAASALVEIVNAIRHLQQGRIPCTQNLLERFVSDDRIITATETTRKKTFVKCSFGFGGRNGVAAISVE